MQQRPIVILLAIQPRTEHMIIQRKDFQKNHFEFDKGRSINDFRTQVCSRIQEILTSQSKNLYLLSNTQALKSWTYFNG